VEKKAKERKEKKKERQEKKSTDKKVTVRGEDWRIETKIKERLRAIENRR